MTKERPEPKTALGRFLRRSQKNVFVAFFIDVLSVVGAALILSLLIKTFLLRSFFIPSGSMLETLQINDRIFVNELVPNVIAPERGDVVVFRDPGGWLGSLEPAKAKPIVEQGVEFFLSAFGLIAPDSSQHLVKRIIGKPGDHVVCCSLSEKLTINGVEITEPYLSPGSKPSTKQFDVIIPADSYWMMGDNRGNSEDSRFHGDLPNKGFVNKKFIVGRAFVVSWPQTHWKWLDNYPDVFKSVPNN
ncbi:MAG: signal peptidase I [Actinobacteria bacterium]|jgi:signal peptidase I|uniref:signal peptidase I n=1 Tax=freshwater metagenome TaxID=449393 RepID=A0A6J6B9C7_9ZZZZ|nr:signal peptidase I [Actinomycetota bacterium]